MALASKVDAAIDELWTYLAKLALPVSGSQAGPPASPPVRTRKDVASRKTRSE